MVDDPVELAHTLGKSITGSTRREVQKDFGQFMTPPAIARLAAATLTASSVAAKVRVLEPAAGAGILACAFCEALAMGNRPPIEIDLTLYEIDRSFEATLVHVTEALAEWLKHLGIALNLELRFEDYVLANAQVLAGGLFDQGESFDFCISNPPYFKVPKSDPRAIACESVVHGQPNIYGFFMAIASASLADGGRLAFIVPRSFASGPYFRTFRSYFFATMRPDSVHVFHARDDAFADDEVLQENVVFAATRVPDWHKDRSLEFLISASNGLLDLDSPELFRLPMDEVLDIGSKEKVLCIPSTKEEVAVFHQLRHWTGSLHRYGWDISTGPVVPFRALEVIVDLAAEDTIPLLWMQNVRAMVTSWPVQTRKSQYIRDCASSAAVILPNRNYVLMRRFSPKEQSRRVVAAPVLAEDLAFACVGLENHLNYVHKPGSSLSVDEVYGLAALLNSGLVDAWFRSTNGNTQVSATEIRSMPLPSIEAIRAIGKYALRAKSLQELDAAVELLTMHPEREVA